MRALKLITVMRVTALTSLLVVGPAAWATAAPHAGGGGHEGGEHGGGAHGGGEHMGDGHRSDEHRDNDGRRGWSGYGWYGAPDPYPQVAAPQYWYYCGSAGAYYPYVAACPEGWQPVVP
jgi:hypothetical protein